MKYLPNQILGLLWQEERFALERFHMSFGPVLLEVSQLIQTPKDILFLVEAANNDAYKEVEEEKVAYDHETHEENVPVLVIPLKWYFVYFPCHSCLEHV
jgi:hypothetical protein